MNNIFTICYSEEEANEIGHFIMSKGYEGVQNDSYRYYRESIRWALKQSKKTSFILYLCWCYGLSNVRIQKQARS